MKIISLKSENVKRLRAVEIKPDGSAVVIRGKNGQGKTSILDSIVYALGGKKTHPKKVVRNGAEYACVVLETEEFTVERRWTDDETTKLEVRSREGKRHTSPQRLLDDLVGSLSFDPLAFMRLKPADQAETLRELVGLDFSDLEEQRTTLYDKRREHNVEVRRLKDRLPAADPETPPEPIETEELVEQLEWIHKLQKAKDSVARQRQKVEELETQLNGARLALSSAEAAVTEVESTRDLFRDPESTRDEIRARLSQAEEHNKTVRESQRIREDFVNLKAEQEKADLLTERLDEIDRRKTNRIADVNFPVDGLAFGDEGVVFEDLPFEQASQSDQLRVSMAMGIALNPRLKVILIREASFLDAEHLQLVAQMAEEADFQVWLECVDEGGAGVIIEDGTVREVKSDAPKPKQDKRRAAS